MLQFRGTIKVGKDADMMSILRKEGVNFEFDAKAVISGDHCVTGVFRKHARAQAAEYILRSLNSMTRPEGTHLVVALLSPSSEELPYFNSRTWTQPRGGKGKPKNVKSLWVGCRQPEWMLPRDITLGLQTIPWTGPRPDYILGCDIDRHASVLSCLDSVPGYAEGVPMIVVVQQHSRIPNSAATYSWKSGEEHFSFDYTVSLPEGDEEREWSGKSVGRTIDEGCWHVGELDGRSHILQYASRGGTQYYHPMNFELSDLVSGMFEHKGFIYRYGSAIVRTNDLYTCVKSSVTRCFGVDVCPEGFPLEGLRANPHLFHEWRPSARSRHLIVEGGRLVLRDNWLWQVARGMTPSSVKSQAGSGAAVERHLGRAMKANEAYLTLNIDRQDQGPTYSDLLRSASGKSWVNACKQIASDPDVVDVLLDGNAQAARLQRQLWFQQTLGVSDTVAHHIACVTGADTVLELAVYTLQALRSGISWLASQAWDALCAAARAIRGVFVFSDEGDEAVKDPLTLSTLSQAFRLCRTLMGKTGAAKNLLKKGIAFADCRNLLGDDYRLVHPWVSDGFDIGVAVIMSVVTAAVEEVIKRANSVGALLGAVEGILHVVNLWLEEEQSLTASALAISFAVLSGHVISHLILLMMPLFAGIALHALYNFLQSRIRSSKSPIYRLIWGKVKGWFSLAPAEHLKPFVDPPIAQDECTTDLLLITEDGPVPLQAADVDAACAGSIMGASDKTVFLADSSRVCDMFAAPSGSAKDFFMLDKHRLRRVPPPFDKDRMGAANKFMRDLFEKHGIYAELEFDMLDRMGLFLYIVFHPHWSRAKKSGWLEKFNDEFDGAALQRWVLTVKTDEILLLKLLEEGIELTTTGCHYLKVRPILPMAGDNVTDFAVSVPRKEAVDGLAYAYNYQTDVLRVDTLEFLVPLPSEVVFVYLATVSPQHLNDADKWLAGSHFSLRAHGDDVYALSDQGAFPADISQCDASCREDNVQAEFAYEIRKTARGDPGFRDRALANMRKNMIHDRAVRIKEFRGEEFVVRRTYDTATGAGTTGQQAAFATKKCFFAMIHLCRQRKSWKLRDMPSILLEAYALCGFTVTGEWRNTWIDRRVATFLGGRYVSQSGEWVWVPERLMKSTVAPALRLYGTDLTRELQLAAHAHVLSMDQSLMSHPLMNHIVGQMVSWGRLAVVGSGWSQGVFRARRDAPRAICAPHGPVRAGAPTC
jgi:hypothetical protein